MSYKIIPTPNFERELKKLVKKYPSLRADISSLNELLEQTPIQGAEIFKNCYKIRFAIKSKGRGKSGGGWLVTFVKIQNERVYLLSIYDKSEKDTVSDQDIKYLLRDLQ